MEESLTLNTLLMGEFQKLLSFKSYCSSSINNYNYSRSILVAACEQKSFIVLDPISRKDVHSVHNSHSDCVNCVR